MLTQNQLTELKQKLEASQNPLFFFDNDADGLCSFLILRRALDRGKGIAIKSFPDLKEQYIKKVDELQPDLIVILDKAELSKEFAEQAEQKNIPIIWIDHHETKTPKEVIAKTHYYNTLETAKSVYQRSGLSAKRTISEADYQRSGLSAKRTISEAIQSSFQRLMSPKKSSTAKKTSGSQ